jgi:hypothetical protein
LNKSFKVYQLSREGEKFCKTQNSINLLDISAVVGCVAEPHNIDAVLPAATAPGKKNGAAPAPNPIK